ncbi:hypothetical protein [Mycobacterium montefiorense]|uniref:Uncharacterized protein n=1 Tax=Mycobacterium montefiorense TaxID=154654 RepID=A0AA37PIB4_9MYCO|nr:hypothetical protein [Mycobacterium montefiorense]GBG37307.1 hypothetical protein MmonteBS_16790 [Mycobacterium montefiorense]GKU35807.1 hypothetical protein NJB14191_31530 [Mycobacterium montefiorense]GKU39772.1 hypothetical protein NJB14192_17620 [Mycobacterium montefiorense]GKU47646.1 hypothetical protein NJB14194_42640 [Mycobacterium montefiorense]GKU48888.1 hypothetical protein NJB14195_01370 [Mycobacterium montefiorense]
MSVQDDKTAGQEADQQAAEQPQDADQQLTEKPKPGEEQKEKAAEMMTAYEDRPTLVLPGSGGAVSGTAIGAWLDDDGNPKNNESPDGKGSGDDKAQKEQIEKDKALNEELKKLAAEDNKGEKRPAAGGRPS